MHYRVDVEDPSASEGYRYYIVGQRDVDAILASNVAPFVRLIEVNTNKSYWVPRVRIVRIAEQQTSP